MGRFLTAEPLPQRLLFAEPLRRRMRVKLGGDWIADSEEVVLLHEPGRYPVAYFPLVGVRPNVLVNEGRTTSHRDFGDTAWFHVNTGARNARRSAWQHIALPAYADILEGRVAFAWQGMDAFYEEDERIIGHAADPYHRIDTRQTSRHLVVRIGDRVVADTIRPIVLLESGFAPCWYVMREDINESALIPTEEQTFCPYKGLANYYDIGDRKKSAWSYPQAWPEVARITNLVSFEADKIEVFLDGKKFALPPGQTVIPHGIDRGLDPDEAFERGTNVIRPCP